MCGIGGLISLDSTNVIPLAKTMMKSMNKRGPDGTGLFIDNKLYQYKSPENILCNSPNTTLALGHNRLAIVGDKQHIQPFQSCDGKLVMEHNGEIYNYKMLKEKLKKEHHFVSNTDSEIVVHLLEHYYKETGFSDLLKAIRKTVADIDGIYALAIKDRNEDKIYLVRDRLGIRQIYYGRNDTVIGFASERKGLWQIGILEPTFSLLPGHCVILSDKISSPIKISEPPINYSNEPTFSNLEDAISSYKTALYNSIKKRSQDLSRIGIIFSGGIDSVLIAKITKELVPHVTCYTSGLAGSDDIKFSKLIADELDLELKINELNVKDIENMLPNILNIIETNNSTQAEVSIPIFGALKLAAKDGLRVVFTGQGADELFGGYPWYFKIVSKYGYSKLKEYMIQDLLLLYKETLEREDKLAMANSIEMREPFLDSDVVKTATSINMNLNIFNNNDIFGKRVHRELAIRVGIPKDIAYREKQAAQHGAGIHGILTKIAEKNGFNKKMVTKEYITNIAKREKLGSSERYGYLFDAKTSWNSSPWVQLYLDKLNNLNQIACEIKR
ncbi:MAG: asnB2 [Nitrososphaeraceae archaeon]|jgi:asparagine synthase (glutamine-hydrolysing)|nr:asnB2 [Nitrososphaeraceae archaeon]